MCKKQSTAHRRHEKSPKSDMVQGTSFRREFALSEIHSMAWNQRKYQEHLAAEEPYPVAEAHFAKFARSRLTKQTEYVRVESSSSWTFACSAGISFIIQDMDALGRSCSEEAATGFPPRDEHHNLQQRHIRSANSRRALIRITASPKGRAKHGPASLLAFLQPL